MEGSPEKIRAPAGDRQLQAVRAEQIFQFFWAGRSADAKVPSEKGNPKSLRKLYLAMEAGIESNIALLVEQAMERIMEQEQFSVGWEEG